MHAIDVTGASHEAQLAREAHQEALDNSNTALRILALTRRSSWAPGENDNRTAFQQMFQININIDAEDRNLGPCDALAGAANPKPPPDRTELQDAQDAIALARAKSIGPVQ